MSLLSTLESYHLTHFNSLNGLTDFVIPTNMWCEVTYAYFSWNRNQDEYAVVADPIWLYNNIGPTQNFSCIISVVTYKRWFFLLSVIKSSLRNDYKVPFDSFEGVDVNFLVVVFVSFLYLGLWTGRMIRFFQLNKRGANNKYLRNESLAQKTNQTRGEYN